ncbi:MAG TPA: hypothetical protein VGM88_14670 [Kofleriaceae bacterium]
MGAAVPAVALAQPAQPPATPTPAPGAPTTPVAATPAPAPTPTPAQLAKAKAAFAAGKKAFDKGDFEEAAAKFSESYKLSGNAVLLYNIGLAHENAGDKDIALHYYRKFLTDAPPDSAQRQEVTDKVAALDKEFAPPPPPVVEKPAHPVNAGPAKISKPPGTYSAADFQHIVVETAPPAKPLDVTASVPNDSGFVATLFYRTAGEGKFASKDFTWRYNEIVARIPPNKMIGTAVQYYIVVKDATGAEVTRSGKPTSPNIVNLEVGAQERFYPDMNDEGEVKSDAEITTTDIEDDDPLHKHPKRPTPSVIENPHPGQQEIVYAPRKPIMPIGSKQWEVTKYVFTGLTVVGLGGGVAFAFAAHSQAQGLENDVGTCTIQPCHKFDDYDQNIQKTGKRYQALEKAGFIGGGVAGLIAGYMWIREAMHTPDAAEHPDPAKAVQEAKKWRVVPTITSPDGVSVSTGAAATVRF